MEGEAQCIEIDIAGLLEGEVTSESDIADADDSSALHIPIAPEIKHMPNPSSSSESLHAPKPTVSALPPIDIKIVDQPAFIVESPSYILFTNENQGLYFEAEQNIIRNGSIS